MHCTRCGSSQIIRSRRKGLVDQLKSSLGHWPYRCEECAFRFTAPYRYIDDVPQAPAMRVDPLSHAVPGESFRAQAAAAERESAGMAFETHSEKPHAKIVVQADTHEQLNNILLALNKAVNSYQSPSTSQGYSNKHSESTASR